MKALALKITKETGKLLKEIRENAKLTQREVGERLGFSGKNGRVYVSKLETGKIENPSLWLILNYLTICEKPWASFFEKLSGIYFTKRHEQIMAQVPTSKLFKKVDRDIAKYTHSIDTKFARKLGIKPIEPKQKQKMSVALGKYRAVIENIERDITVFLGNSGEPFILNQYYKAFAREVYRTIRKIKPLKEDSTDAMHSAINIKLNQIIEKWVKKGLKREVLEQVKDIPLKYIKPLI